MADGNAHSGEYMAYDRKWLLLHRRVLLGVAAASLVVEILTAVSLTASGILDALSWDYVRSYILAPSGLMAAVVLFAYAFTRAESACGRPARFAVSLSFTALCLILYIAHGFFPSMCLPLLASIVMTTVYGDYALTSLTFAVSFLGLVAGRLLRAGQTALSGVEMTVDFLFTLLMFAGLYLICLALIQFERQKRRESIEKERLRLTLQRQACIDPLTGLQNRRALRDALDSLPGQESPRFFVMCDLNGFKALNDTYGHPTGDKCLVYFSRVLCGHCAAQQVFRYGGDELCILFSGQARQAVQAVCAAILRELAQNSARETGVSFSASFGGAELLPGMSVTALVRAADSALYRAKKRESSIFFAEEAPRSK